MCAIERATKAQKLKKLLAEGVNRKKALVAIGYSEQSAQKAGKTICNRLLGNVSVKQDTLTLSDHITRRGYDDKAIADVLVDGLQASKVISAVVKPGGNEQSASGATTDFIEVPDHAVRGQYIDRIAKIRGYYPDPKLRIEHSGQVTHRYESIIALITEQESDDDVIDIEIEPQKVGESGS